MHYKVYQLLLILLVGLFFSTNYSQAQTSIVHAANYSITITGGSPTEIQILQDSLFPSSADAFTVNPSSPMHGTVVYNPVNADLIYTPDANYNGPDSFTYTFTANGVTSDNSGIISIIISGNENQNNSFSCNTMQTTFQEEKIAVIDGLSTCNQAGGNSLSIVNVGIPISPQFGSIRLQNDHRTIFYHANNNYIGTDSFSVTVTNGINQITYLSKVTITPLNRPPVADQIGPLNTKKNTPITFTLSGHEERKSSKSFVFAIVSNPQHGTIIGTIPNLTYTPTLDFVGSDSFSYKANDGNMDSNAVTVQIMVKDVTKPVANNVTSSSTMDQFATNTNDITNTQSPIKIPPWLKNNAKWWSEDSLTDDDFIKTVQFMIKSGMMKIPQSQITTNSSQQIPHWIKQNAGLWSSGNISDNEFIAGIQYLVTNGIIKS